jgi:hypothetical protein
MLPEPGVDAETTFPVYHAVDNGDIVLVVKPVLSRKYCWLFAKPYPAQSTKHADNLVNVNVFLNVVQVNYVLAGITNRLWHLYQRDEQCGVVKGKNTWDTLISSFGRYVDNFVKNMLARTGAGSKDLCRFFLQSLFLLQHIVQFHIVPSEHENAEARANAESTMWNFARGAKNRAGSTRRATSPCRRLRAISRR